MDPSHALDPFSPAFGERFDAVLLDLDGTLRTVGGHLLPGAGALIERLIGLKRRWAVLSNSTLSPARVAELAGGLGLPIDAGHVWTAAAATCDYVVERFGVGGHVFNLLSASAEDLLIGRAVLVDSPHDRCDAVIVGTPQHSACSPDRQRIAVELLRDGAALVGACADRVYTSPRGVEIGAGSVCAMLAYAADVTPTFCGKPESVFFHELCRRMEIEPSRCLIIGDNAEADIAGAKAVGMSAVLVLSGVSRAGDVDKLPRPLRPDLIVNGLTDLL